MAFAYLFQIVVEHRLVDWLSPIGAALVVSGAAIITVYRWLKGPSADEEDDAGEGKDEAMPLRFPQFVPHHRLPQGPKRHSLLVVRPSFRNESQRSGMVVPWL